jgi:O-antigen ligase
MSHGADGLPRAPGPGAFNAAARTPRVGAPGKTAKSRAAPRLTFTGCLVQTSFGLGLMFALARPLVGSVPGSTYVKHLPLVLFLLAISLHAIAMAAQNDGRLYTRGMSRSLWPFLLLGIFAAAGSLYARIGLHQENTFLTLGLYLLAMPLFFVWGRDEANGTSVVKPLMLLWLLLALAAIAGSVAQIARESPLHESEFLLLPVFLYWYLASRSTRARWAAILMLIVASILTRKITGYVIGLCALLYAIGLPIVHTPKKWRGVVYALAALGLVLTIAGAVGAYVYFRQYLPTGNARVRLHQYAAVLREFSASPIWGDAYASSSGVTFVEGGFPMLIPTHSDVLDLLREGGCIGFVLWLSGMIRAIRTLTSRTAPSPEAKAFLQAMVFTVLATVFSYSFNPLLLKPPQAFVIWGMLSLALSVATDRRPGQLNGV